jgi:hypothetical protein
MTPTQDPKQVFDYAWRNNREMLKSHWGGINDGGKVIEKGSLEE